MPPVCFSLIITGAERAEWALDNVVIAVNESATLGFEEHFNPMQPDVWYRAMNAVPRITCSSRDDALVFSKNGGRINLPKFHHQETLPPHPLHIMYTL